MTRIKRRCQDVLKLEIKAECRERVESCSTKSSITAKVLMQCLLMFSGEYLGPRGPSYVILGGAFDRRGLLILTSKAKRKLNGRLAV
jgi:hypothetical protein